MTNQQLQLIQQSWKLLRDIDPTVLGDVFYGQLFRTYPALRSMFASSMENQYRKFVDMLSIIIARLDRPTVVALEISQLARTHKGYKVKPEHYVAVKEAFLWTLERGLGNDWNDAVQQAWVACYDGLTHSMLDDPNPSVCIS